jgi:hypothetical protein
MREDPDDPWSADRLLARYGTARAARSTWEAHWQDCYDVALPQAGGRARIVSPGERRTERVYDGTAPDAVEQLAAGLLAALTPPFSRWFGLAPGVDVPPADADRLAPVLERATGVLQTHFDRSNLAVELHQCHLDLVVAGTACLLFEEAPPGEASAFRFAAVPLAQVVMEEGPSGRLDGTFRRSEPTLADLLGRFGRDALPARAVEGGVRDPDRRFPLTEAALPDGTAVRYAAVLETDTGPVRLAHVRLRRSPFVNFRWMKTAGEVYGRSPVMKALPDIRTANKVVELVLKNASIAVTGIWQADDDGVLNPASIRLVPGTIIPKAVGSAGLTPLAAPGRFDVSQLVLDDLRARIRNALLVDRLGPVAGPRMTATEVAERAAETARLLGATFGRLQGELLVPLVLRGLAILARRGEVPELMVDGRLVDLQWHAPLARAQAQRDVRAVLGWLDGVAALGPDGQAVVDAAAAARWLGRALGVPPSLVRAADPDPIAPQRRTDP